MLTIAVPTGRTTPPALANHPAEVTSVDDPFAALSAGSADAALVFVRDRRAGLPDGTSLAAVVQRPDPQATLFTRDELRLKDLPGDMTLAVTEEALCRQIASARPESPAPTVVDLGAGLAGVANGTLGAFVAVLSGPAPEDAPPSRVLASKVCLHAPLDGIAMLVVREGDDAAREAARAWHDPRTEIALAAERALLEALADSLGLDASDLPIGGDCSIPGAYHTVKAVVAPPCDRSRLEPVRAEIATETTVPPDEAGQAAAAALLEAGAAEYLTPGR